MKIVDVLGVRAFKDGERIITQVHCADVWTSGFSYKPMMDWTWESFPRVLCLQGEEADCFYIVESGEAKIMIKSKVSVRLICEYLYCLLFYMEMWPFVFPLTLTNITFQFGSLILAGESLDSCSCSSMCVADDGGPAGRGGGSGSLHEGPIFWGAGAGHQQTSCSLSLCCGRNQMFRYTYLFYTGKLSLFSSLMLPSQLIMRGNSNSRESRSTKIDQISHLSWSSLFKDICWVWSVPR